jgi:cytochrome b subunit of formate dehydrogenase
MNRRDNDKWTEADTWRLFFWAGVFAIAVTVVTGVALYSGYRLLVSLF